MQPRVIKQRREEEEGEEEGEEEIRGVFICGGGCVMGITKLSSITPLSSAALLLLFTIMLGVLLLLLLNTMLTFVY